MILSSLRYDYGVMNAERMERPAFLLEGTGPHNMAEQLQTSLHAAQLSLLKIIAGVSEAQSAAIYLVGGPVRDLLLGVAIKDIDLVVEGRALRLASDLKDKFGGEITEHKRFGTAKWKIAEIKQSLFEQLGPDLPANELPDSVDLISARKETYAQSGALPKVEFAGIEEDTQRRDFTLNTLAVRLDGEHFGELLDFWGGLDDLATGQLRVLHEKSFIDDPTRILRIHRFAMRFSFKIEERTQVLLMAGLSGLEKISGERIRNEFDLILAEPAGSETLNQLQLDGILEAIHPELHFDAQMASALDKLPDTLPIKDWELKNVTRLDLAYVMWLGKLSGQNAMDVSGRLRFDSGLSRAIHQASQFRLELKSLADAKPSETVVRLEKLSPLARYALYLDSDNEGPSQKFLGYAKSWRKIRPQTDGRELLSRGLPEGPRYKEILADLRAAWLDGDISSIDQEEKYLEKLLNEPPK